MLQDWHATHRLDHDFPAVVDSRRRIGTIVAVFGVLLALVGGRLLHLEWTQGAAFREESARPIERRHTIPALRGRILARNGVVMARDCETLALAVHYRVLQEPPDPGWLRARARSRLTREERRDPVRVRQAEAEALAERERLVADLCVMSGLNRTQWSQRAARIQTRVERIAEGVNRRRLEQWQAQAEAEAAAVGHDRASWRQWVVRFIGDVFEGSMDHGPPERIVVAEEVDYHIVVESVSIETAAEIEANPERYPFVRIVSRPAREYVGGRTASHVLGYLGHVTADELGGDAEIAWHPEDRVGRVGVEATYDPFLRGMRGQQVELRDRSGRLLESRQATPPRAGCDVMLAIDLELQASAEQWLGQAMAQREVRYPESREAGGAVVVMDAENGELLALVSLPDYDPNCFMRDEPSGVVRLLTDPSAPLFDRASQMAIPIGSVFKVVAAAALLEEGVVRPEHRFHCQGYLKTPDTLRCSIFIQTGQGHGEVTLGDALCESCNVYFFHHARKAGRTPLSDWADRFGFGQATGVDLPGEGRGYVPMPRPVALGSTVLADPEAVLLAVGQGQFRATPLQVARMTAAIANGGRLVTPHVLREVTPPPNEPLWDHADDAPPRDVLPPRRWPSQPVPGLHLSTLEAIREGMRRAVADPQGTVYAAGFSDTVPYAAKTGTAETDGPRPAHAWVAAYVPVQRPRYVVVVAMEHAGDSSIAACPLVRRLILRLAELGYVGRPS